MLSGFDDDCSRADSMEFVLPLCPFPHSVHRLPGAVLLDERIVGDTLEMATPPIPLALHTLRAELRKAAQHRSVPRGGVSIPRLTCRVNDGARTDRAATWGQGYHLRVTPGEVGVTGNSEIGLVYGVRTLAQLVRVLGCELPCVEIEDQPDFATRGVSYDISRGRVPTMDGLRSLVDQLADVKINQLQLYTEHTFAFAFDPAISADASPLTADEVRALDTYCADRGVELVPSLASFGHMGRILSLPQYSHFAEVGIDRPWEAWTLRERVRGLTLDATNPESRDLLRRMYAEYLPLFRSLRVNVTCDEPFDLGAGRGGERVKAVGAARVFLDHVCWLRELCAEHGKQIMVWGDFFKSHPEALAELPSDVTVLHWDYEAAGEDDAVRRAREVGLTTWVCPGTSAWNRLVNDLNVADRNIRRLALSGRRHGATGILTTDWGDEGHVGPPGASVVPLALGAAVGWSAATPSGQVFDDLLGGCLLGEGGAEVIAAWREVSRTSDMVRIWPAFCEPLGKAELPKSIDADTLDAWRNAAGRAVNVIAGVRSRHEHQAALCEDLSLAFELHVRAGRRLALGERFRAAGERVDSGLRHELSELAESLDHIMGWYAEAWRAGSRANRLDDVLGAFRRVRDECRELARG